jgi:hypothetical protein
LNGVGKLLVFFLLCFLSPQSAPSSGVSTQNPSVLYRLLNGEMPDDFNPKIWWLELGLSDLGLSQCSEEVVVVGVLRVVEEIMNRKPQAKIVINSLFPMTDLRQQVDPQAEDMGLEQSFGEKPKKPDPKVPKNNNKVGGNKAGGNKASDAKASGNNPVGNKAGGSNAAGKKSNGDNPGGRKKGGNDPAGSKTVGKNPTGRKAGGNDPNGSKADGNNAAGNETGVNNPAGNKPGKRRTRGVRHLEMQLPHATDGAATEKLHRSNDSRVLPTKTTTKISGNQKTQHKFNPVTHKENKLPLWTSIMAINKELAKFAGKHDNVYFFDVTGLFTEEDGIFFNLKTNLITGIGIPSEDGYNVWEEALATRARQILTGQD